MKEKKIERVSAREGYDLWGATYDSTPNPVVAMDSRHTIKLLSPAPGELILDAGSGTGRNLQQLLSAGSSPIGIDFSLGMLTVAQRNWPEVPTALADLERSLPFGSEIFDAALCALIGEHLSEMHFVLEELYRVLRPGGRLVFSVYHPAMSAAGIEANFEQQGTEYRLGAFHYSVQEHVHIFEEARFVDIVLYEFSGDDELIRSVPAAQKYLGFPVLLVLTANKPPLC